MCQLAGRALVDVHHDLDLPVAVAERLSQHGDGALLVGQTARQVPLVDHDLEATRFSRRCDLSTHIIAETYTQ